MRKIKFRSWVVSKATNTSWMNNEIEFVGGKINDIFNSGESQFADITYMQYTGLKDKNDTEIYEGDVVETGWQGDTKGVVVFEEAMFFVKSGDSTMYFNHPDRYEVIGNIYENPEML